MSLGLNKIVLAGTNSNTPGGYFQATTLTATTVGNVVPAGTYLLFPTANVSITAVSATNAAGNITAVSTLLAANTGGVLISDGVSVFANATTNATVTLLTVNGGNNANGTYNS